VTRRLHPPDLRRCRLLATALLCACGAWTTGATAADRFDAETLVPAAFGIRTDRAGSSWSVEAAGNLGRIGSAMVNSGLALLIDEEKFAPYRPMMTADGKELVLQGLPLDALPGLRVQRRIRLLDEPGGLRYAELFHNASGDPLTISVGLATNFSGNFKTFLSERGRSEPLLLGPAETALVVLPGASQSSRAFLFTLAGASGGERPSVSSQNRYGLTFRYRLDLAPGETGVIVHHVAQIAIPQTLDRQSLLRASRPYALDRLRAGFDPAWLPFVANATEPPAASPRAALAAGGAGSLGLAPSPTDTLAIGESTRLPGKAEGGPLTLVSPYGEAEFPLDRLAAIAGGKHRGDGRTRLFLRDGQILSGQVSSGDLGFVPAQGARISIDPATLDRLVLAKAPTAPEAWPAGTAAILETHDGDRIRLASSGEGPLLQLATPWGTLPVFLDDLVWLRPAASGGPGHRVLLKNGTECEGFLDASGIALAGGDFAKSSLPASRLKHVFTEAAWKLPEGEGIPLAGSAVRLPGGQTLQGRITDTTLSLLSEGTPLEIALAEIRRVERIEPGAGSARFRIERWDDGVLDASPAAEFLSLEVAGRTWQIPLRDLAGLELSPPALDAAALAKIEALVANLASPDWATRETATRELGAFGYLARPLLRRELAATTDAEVARRLERVLSARP